MHCRFCNTLLSDSFCDLGLTPLSNSYLHEKDLHNKEAFYPLHAYVCRNCFLVQLQEFESPQEIFHDYAYFSSYSDTWLKHAECYTEKMIERFGFDHNSFVVEIASNDGYLLQYFKEKNIPILGIEPAANVAEVAEKKGIPTLVQFFGIETAIALLQNNKKADLVLGNNVLAHVPNLIDFVTALKIFLAPTGIITLEFPHLLKLMLHNQFDTIYHEHFSYFSFLTVERIFAHHSLTLFDVEELATHGGSLRIYARHTEDLSKPISKNVDLLKSKEFHHNLHLIDPYLSFHAKAIKTKEALSNFLHQVKKSNKTLVGYGAPAKGNTLLNYCGIRSDLIPYTADLSPHKQGRFLPGSHIPIKSPEAIANTKPDYVLILPWNLKEEIMQQLSFIRNWEGKFVIPIPEVEVLP